MLTVPSNEKCCWATLLTKTSYLQGCLVLNQSLTQHSSYPLVVFATESLPQEARTVLKASKIVVHDIDYIEPKGKVYLDVHDQRFADTWTKLGVFGLTEYDRIVLLDSDMLVMNNMDELMTMEMASDQIAAAHACTCNPRKLAHYPKNWTPENCAHTLAQRTTPLPASKFTKPTHHLLNSGLVVLTPSSEVYASMLDFLHTSPLVPTFQFPDQDLLAHVFRDKFIPLSYRYNALKTLKACHPDMWRDEDLKNVHYILDKPWNKRVEEGDPNAETHAWWWKAYEELIQSWGNAPGRELIESLVAPRS